MTTTIATTAAEVVPGDIIVVGAFTREGFVRRRVTQVATLDVVITDPAKRTRTVYPTVRYYFGTGRGAESSDYNPGDVVNVVR